MRILDRYPVRQLIPVWLWCLVVFIFLSCLIDLFEHLDEIVRYHIPAKMIVHYYLNFAPFVFVKASPLALLLSAAFIASRLSRYQELLAMNASGTSLLRASVPFLFVGWLASLCVFFVNDAVVPRTSAVYEQIRRDAFHGRKGDTIRQNVAAMDAFNRLYHARELNLSAHEAKDLTILEHDRWNRPTKSLYANRAIWTKFGWLLLGGTLYRVGPRGTLRGDPEPFAERLISYPITPEAFLQSEDRPETMRFGQLRLLIVRLKQLHIADIRRYEVDLIGKVTLPLMNLVIGLIGFTGSSRPQLRGNLRGLGMSLGWGLVYYFAVGFGEGVGKKGLWFIPAPLAAIAPHAIAVWLCVRVLRQTR